MHRTKGFGNPLRLVLIGAGKMGEAHAAAFSTLPGVEIVGVASRGGDSAARLAARYGIPKCGSDWRRLAEETEADACVVAVSHVLNEKVTAEVIDLGLHVLAEKPVAFNSTAIRSLAARADAKGVTAMAAMNRRFFASVLTAIDLVRLYGGVRGVTVIAPDPVQSFRSQGSYDPWVYDHWLIANTLHAIDLFRLAGGEVECVRGDASTDESTGERSIVATLRFRGGALGCFISHSGAGGAWELRIHGDGIEAHLTPLERGTIRVGNASPRPLPSARSTDRQKPGLRAQAIAFAEAVCELGRVTPPASDLYDHALSMELAENLDQLGLCDGAAIEREAAGYQKV